MIGSGRTAETLTNPKNEGNQYPIGDGIFVSLTVTSYLRHEN